MITPYIGEFMNTLTNTVYGMTLSEDLEAMAY
jgi:hypothetical protein